MIDNVNEDDIAMSQLPLSMHFHDPDAEGSYPWHHFEYADSAAGFDPSVLLTVKGPDPEVASALQSLEALNLEDVNKQ